MKKMKSLLMMAVIAATSFSLVSCDDDPWYDGPNNWRDDPYYWYGDYNHGGWGWNQGDWNNGSQGSQNDKLVLEAQTLVGEWRGPVKYSYIEEDGKSRGEDDFYADMVFYQSSNQNGTQGASNSLSGGGIEIDYKYDKDGNVTDSQTLPFSWYIDKQGNIYIKYTGKGSTFVLDAGASQHGFNLGSYEGYQNDIFTGWMIGVGSVEGDLINFNFERVVTDGNKARKLSRSSASDSTSLSFGKGATLQLSGAGVQRLNNRK